MDQQSHTSFQRWRSLLAPTLPQVVRRWQQTTKFRPRQRIQLLTSQAGRHGHARVGDTRAADNPRLQGHCEQSDHHQERSGRERTDCHTSNYGVCRGFVFNCNNCVGVEIDGSYKWQGAPSGKTYGIKLTMTGGGGPSAFLRIAGLSRFVTIRNVEIDGAWPRLASERKRNPCERSIRSNAASIRDCGAKAS